MRERATLTINKQTVPPCRGCSSVALAHWAVADLIEVVGRPLLPADSIEIVFEGDGQPVSQ